jgi:hypothetical protein
VSDQEASQTQTDTQQVEGNKPTGTAATPNAPAPVALKKSDAAKLARAYMVPFSAQAIRHLFGKDAEITPEKAAAFEQYLIKTAIGLYPGFQQQITSGMQPAYLFDPYRQVGKEILGPQFEPDFMTDPNVRAVMNGQTDPTSGRPAPMTLVQWEKYLKTNPAFGWQQTPQGQAARQQIMQTMAQGFNSQGPVAAPPQGGNQ